MAFYKKLPYKLKRWVPMLGLAGATMLGSCSKDNEEPTKDAEIFFSCITIDDQLSIENLQKYINDPSTRNIYMIAVEDWSTLLASNISRMRTALQLRMEMSPKLHGRGDFNFKIGEASKVPADSLWYTQQGWTINRNLQYQK